MLSPPSFLSISSSSQACFLVQTMLKQLLNSLSIPSQWSYAVFWKISPHNPKLLIWEDSYYEPMPCQFPGIQEEDRVCALMNKMMLNNSVNVIGEGIIGRAAYTGNHQWIHLNDFRRDVYPQEVFNELHLQFSAGMQTVAVIPVLHYGVVQLGSFLPIIQNMNLVDEVKSFSMQLWCIPGAHPSEGFSAKVSIERFGNPVTVGVPVSVDPPVITSNPIPSVTYGFNQDINSSPTSRTIVQPAHPLKGEINNHQGSVLTHQTPNITQILSNYRNNLCEPSAIPLMNPGFDATEAEVTPLNARFGSSQPGLADCSIKFKEPEKLSSSGGQSYFNPTLTVPNVFSELKNGAGHVFDRSQVNVSSSSINGGMSTLLRPNLIVNSISGPSKVSSTDFFETRKAGPVLPDDSLTKDDDVSLGDHMPACLLPLPSDDLFDVLGVDLKNKLLNEKWNKLLARESNGDGVCSISGAISDSGVFSERGDDHLLDAVVSNAKSLGKQDSDDMSCWTTLSWTRNASVPSPASRKVLSDHTQGGFSGFPKDAGISGAVEASSLRSRCRTDDAQNCSQTTSIYGSQISSWVKNASNVKCENSVSTGYSKQPDEGCKSNRKRLKPGENPRPRPKDRQMIQDRVKELREIVPNGAKCSIDALLERTIKHMLFLQSVTKHADKLKQAGESKIMSKDGGLLLKDNFDGGATWAYEIGSQSMVCPIIVEDLNPPRQMLVEMLCEERGFFLEIADLIRGLGLTILRGVMETRNDKIWACFAVEANRDVTRMEIFMSLVNLLEQVGKGSACSSNPMCLPFPQATQISIAGGAKCLQ